MRMSESIIGMYRKKKKNLENFVAILSHIVNCKGRYNRFIVSNIVA